jgi:hypothetical protein
MPEYIAEQYFSRTDAAGARRAARAARHAARQLAREGTNVELLTSLFVPEEETSIFVYRADSLDSVRLAGERGALAFDHIAQAATDPARSSAIEPARQQSVTDHTTH